MAKIGVLIFTDKIKDRQIAKDAYFDNIKFFGFRRIINEAAKEHEIVYISSMDINTVDFVLCSITSYYDAYNFLSELKNIEVKSKIIIGGAGLTNPIPFKDKIFACCFGRGEGLINRIIAGEEVPNVYYPHKDPELKKKYEIGQLTDFIVINSETSIDTPTHMKGFKEKHIGCVKKCFFCQYTWKNKLQKSIELEGYKSGFNDCENTIAELNWHIKAPYFVTAIDGLTDRARRIVNRGNITNKAIKDAFVRFFYESPQDKATVKVYCVVGYPFEELKDIHVDELVEIAKEIDLSVSSDKKLNLFVQCTHFVPMPYTPMESEKVNLIDCRNILKKQMLKYDGKHIKLTVLPYITSNTSAVEQTVINRYKDGDKRYMNILLSAKYQKMPNSRKIATIKKIFPSRLYCAVDGSIHDFIETPFDIKKVKKVYYKRAYGDLLTGKKQVENAIS